MRSERTQRRIDRPVGQAEEAADQHARAEVGQLAREVLALEGLAGEHVTCAAGRA